MSEIDFNFLFDSVQDFIYILDLNGQILKTNNILLEKLDYSKEEILKKNVLDLYPSDRKEELASLIKEFDEKKTVFSTVPFLTKKRDYIPVNTKITKGKWREQNVIFGISRDISEQIKIKNELAKSEKLYRNIFKSSPIFIGLINKDGNLLNINDKVEELLSIHTKQDVIGKNFIDILALNEKNKYLIPLFKEYFEKMFRGEKPAPFDFKLYRSIGGFFWCKISSSLVKLDNANIIQFLIQNITEMKEAEQKLKESEEKFYKAFNSNVLSISISTIEEGRFIEANNVFLNDLGFKREEVIGKTSKELNIWVHRSERDSLIKTIKEKGIVNNLEVKFRTKEGEIRQGLFSVNKILLNNIPYLLTIVNDITNYKIAERKLKESEEKFRTIAEQSLVGIGMIQDNMIKFVNQQTSNITGYSVEEILKWDLDAFLKIVHPKYRKLTIENMKRVLQESENLSVKFLNKGIKKSGEIIWVDTIIKKVSLNEKIAILGIFSDVTEKVVAERRLKESEKKFRDAYNRAEFYKDIFAHDINNMLQSILSSNQLISMLSASEVEKEKIGVFLDIISSEVNRGKKLVNSIKNLSQIEEQEVILERIEILSILNKLIGKIKDSVKDKNVIVQIDFKKDECYLQANNLIKDVFENIIINSIRHNRHDNVEIIIKISYLKENGINYCKMEFIDNGIGIEDIRKNEIFYRASQDKKKIYGIGLGLTLVYNIIKTYKGKIWVEDRVKGDYSRGTNFIILIPGGDFFS